MVAGLAVTKKRNKPCIHWFGNNPKTCFSDGIKKLVDGHKKRVELQGQYPAKVIQPLCTFHFLCDWY